MEIDPPLNGAAGHAAVLSGFLGREPGGAGRCTGTSWCPSGRRRRNSRSFGIWLVLARGRVLPLLTDELPEQHEVRRTGRLVGVAAGVEGSFGVHTPTHPTEAGALLTSATVPLPLTEVRGLRSPERSTPLLVAGCVKQPVGAWHWSAGPKATTTEGASRSGVPGTTEETRRVVGSGRGSRKQPRTRVARSLMERAVPRPVRTTGQRGPVAGVESVLRRLAQRGEEVQPETGGAAGRPRLGRRWISGI